VKNVSIVIKGAEKLPPFNKCFLLSQNLNMLKLSHAMFVLRFVISYDWKLRTMLILVPTTLVPHLTFAIPYDLKLRNNADIGSNSSFPAHNISFFGYTYVSSSIMILYISCRNL
jgi:hypothetical protein